MIIESCREPDGQRNIGVMQDRLKTTFSGQRQDMEAWLHLQITNKYKINKIAKQKFKIYIFFATELVNTIRRCERPTLAINPSLSGQ